MINSNEFRSGNLILLTKDNFKTTKEYELNEFDIYKLSENNCIDIKPIPLTEQWLLDFGFIKSEDGFYKIRTIKRLFLEINLLTKKIILYNGIYVELPFSNKVHELQNLYFALKNEELKINKKI